jgi:hypothetical protein
MNLQSIKPFLLHLGSRHRLKAVAVLGAVVVGGVLWVAAAPEAYSPTHYVVRWENTGMCTVVRERPTEEDRKFKIVWFTTLKKVANRKATEFKETGKCGRAPLRRSRKSQDQS